MKIVFLHPDLGIGGAERLVVDAAKALKSKGHNVQFVTSHHDPGHCFPETSDGTLPVTVVGNSMPRSFFGKFYALCAYLRMIYAAYYVAFKSDIEPDVIFCDQISACIPVLKMKGLKVVFYCHFPDQLLTQRKTVLKWLYRLPLDWLEEKTTGMADLVLVNSRFTESVFRQTFKKLHDLEVQVLYPSVVTNCVKLPTIEPSFKLKTNATKIFLSINRYERKKNLSLAIYALQELLKMMSPTEGQKVHLIIAGGYDDNVVENKEYYLELEKIAEDVDLADRITFLKSPSDGEKCMLFHSSTAVLYTPSNEHFGIVPVEAMVFCRPVIACNSGGPLETVLDGETGFLCEPLPEAFAEKMKSLACDKSLARELGDEGARHVKKNFSFHAFTQRLNNIMIS